MSDFATPQSARPHRNGRATRVALAAAALLTPLLLSACMSAPTGGRRPVAGRPTSGYGVPDWVLRECRPASGAEIIARMAGPGDYFYRDSNDFCYFDRRPGVL
jgi:hypothetical protein